MRSRNRDPGKQPCSGSWVWIANSNQGDHSMKTNYTAAAALAGGLLIFALMQGTASSASLPILNSPHSGVTLVGHGGGGGGGGGGNGGGGGGGGGGGHGGGGGPAMAHAGGMSAMAHSGGMG